RLWLRPRLSSPGWRIAGGIAATLALGSIGFVANDWIQNNKLPLAAKVAPLASRRGSLFDKSKAGPLDAILDGSAREQAYVSDLAAVNGPTSHPPVAAPTIAAIDDDRDGLAKESKRGSANGR